MDTRARNWFLTVNNYSVDERNAAEQYKCDYLLIAEEVGEKEHTEHLHIYFELKNAKAASEYTSSERQRRTG
jgi:hypothetical protein